MALAEQDQVEIYEASDEDMRVSVREALARLGLTFDELAAIAAGRFETEAQRRTWFAIKDLGRFA